VLSANQVDGKVFRQGQSSMASFGAPAPVATGAGGTPPAVTTGTAHSADARDHSLGNSVGNDGISKVVWSPTANHLVASSWDGGVRCWEIQEQGGQVRSMPKAQGETVTVETIEMDCHPSKFILWIANISLSISHSFPFSFLFSVSHENQSPVFSACFSGDGNTVFSGGADNAVRMWSLGGAAPPNGVAQQIGVHNAPVKAVGFVKSSNLVVSGGWDRMLKFWDCRQPNPVGQFELPERVYSMDVRDNLLVVACAGRHVVAYDVAGQPREHSRKESPLKYQSRCIACFPDMTGFAVGSIEGRVGIHYLQKVQGKDSFAFKCHRQENTNVYSVNDICFNNAHGTFATVGADGVVNFWDKDNKQRLKGFPAMSRTVACANFNTQGNLFAYAASYDWSKGSQFYNPNVANQNEIFIHYTAEEEIRPKKKNALR
jgi:mRNA export factor